LKKTGSLEFWIKMKPMVSSSHSYLILQNTAEENFSVPLKKTAMQSTLEWLSLD